jgi:nicotinamidase-related amidase
MRALAVICYQNDYVKEPNGYKYAKIIENNICARITDTLDSDGDVYLIMDWFPKSNDGEERHLCEIGSEGSEPYGKVSRFLSDVHIIRKNTYGSEDLFKRLKPYDNIELCGLETHTDVLCNTMIARTCNPNARIVVRQNCVSSRDFELAEKAMEIMESVGVDVI